MNYTKETPPAPGFYWMLFDDGDDRNNEPRVVEVLMQNDIMIARFGDEWSAPLEKWATLKAVWAGPLVPPEGDLPITNPNYDPATYKAPPPHETVPVQVWVDVDKPIAEMVRYLNYIPDIRTVASCQGTIGEGGPNPYRANVMITWSDDATFEELAREFEVTPVGDHCCYLHPRDGRYSPAPVSDLRTELKEAEAYIEKLTAAQTCVQCRGFICPPMRCASCLNSEGFRGEMHDEVTALAARVDILTAALTEIKRNIVPSQGGLWEVAREALDSTAPALGEGTT